MCKHLFIFSIVLLTVVACATQPPPQFNFSAGTRVGIVNLLEPDATHAHFSAIRIESFTKSVKVDWNLPQYMQKRIRQQLQRDSRYSVAAIKAPLTGLADLGRLGNDHIPLSDKKKAAAAAVIEQLADQHRLDVVIIIKSFRGPSPWKLGKEAVQLHGYGLYTKQFWSLNFLKMSPYQRAYAYAQLIVLVYKARPATLIGSGKASQHKAALDNFKWPANMKDLSAADLNQIRPRIFKYADQAVSRALQNSNLVASKKETPAVPVQIAPH